MANNNISRLIEAGILASSAVLLEEEIAAIESLTAAEVDAVITVKQKLGAGFFERHAVPRADFIF